MLKLCGIYKITSPSNKVYIGQSVDISRRFQTYRTQLPHAQAKLCSSFKKYGADNHKFEVLELCACDDLNSREEYYISSLCTFNTKEGMNLKSSSGRGCTLSDETKLKIGMSNRGKGRGKGWRHSEEAKMKIRIGHIGKKSSFIKIVSHDTRMKISKKLKGITHSEDRKRNIAIGKSLIPRTNILQISMDGHLIKRWPSAKDASIHVGGDPSCIYKACKGIITKHKGFKWATA